MRRVVVTGIGAVTPVGNNVPEFWEAIKNGKNGIAPITRFDVSESKYKLAAEVKEFDPTKYMDKLTAKKLDRFVQFAMVAASEAMTVSWKAILKKRIWRFISAAASAALKRFAKAMMC